jgi:predicted nucleic acid-binding protein
VILVDTSVWVAHLRSGTPALSRALLSGEVLGHPHVLGELACGNLRDRAAIRCAVRAGRRQRRVEVARADAPRRRGQRQRQGQGQGQQGDATSPAPRLPYGARSIIGTP